MDVGVPGFGAIGSTFALCVAASLVEAAAAGTAFTGAVLAGGVLAVLDSLEAVFVAGATAVGADAKWSVIVCSINAPAWSSPLTAVTMILATPRAEFQCTCANLATPEALV